MVLLVLGGGAIGQDGQEEFLSWYDGWGTHTVWGVGKIKGHYRDARVQCGTRSIPVRAIHDTHNSDRKPLAPTQTRHFARSKNAATLRKIESRGDKCSFE